MVIIEITSMQKRPLKAVFKTELCSLFYCCGVAQLAPDEAPLPEF